MHGPFQPEVIAVFEGSCKTICFQSVQLSNMSLTNLRIVLTSLLLAVNLIHGAIVNLDAKRFLSSEGNISIYDHAMPLWLTHSFYSVLKNDGGRWRYEYPDEPIGVSSRHGSNFFWVAPLSPTFLMKTKTWIVFKKLAEDFTGVKGYVPYEVTGTMLRRGDFPAVSKGSNGTDEIYLRLFLTPKVGSLSDMVFFNKNGDIVKAVQHKMSRIAVWNATFDYQYKPPDFDSILTELSILVKFTKDVGKVRKQLKYIKYVRDDEQMQKASKFPYYGIRKEPFTKDFFDQHCTNKYYDKRGGVISVFDNILGEQELEVLRKFLVKYNSAYVYGEYTTYEDDDGDNVNWMAMFTPELILETRILDIIKELGKYLSGEDDWYPYDVSLNMVQKTFHTRIHEDCESYEFEYTFLLYLNTDWTEDMYGETSFFNQVQDAIVDKKGKMIQQKEFEHIISVRPKYGRMVMFRNNIPHSARPPSPDFHGSRYTFAVKVSRSKLVALTKTLREVLEFKGGVGDEGLSDIAFEMAKTKNFIMSATDIAGNITKYRKQRSDESSGSKTVEIDSLIRKMYLGDNKPTI